MHTRMPFLELLSSAEIRQIHLGALRVLEETGLWLPHQEILERLAEAGAAVDFVHKSVCFPPHLVEASLKQIPPRFTWYARNPHHSLDLNGYETHFAAPDSAIHVIDLEGRRREANEDDGELICHLCDALPNLSCIATGVHPPHLPETVLDAWLTKTMFTHSSKAVFGPSRSRASSEIVLRMAEVVGQSCGLPAGRLPLIAATNTVSPLYNTPDQLDGMLEYVRRGVPLLITPEVQAGATGPATIAGTLVQATAEFLGHATIAQVFRPGLPLMYGCVSSVFDMRKMMLPYGAPEADLLGIATAQIARFYGIPSRGTGGASDANCLGMQAGVESLMSNLMCLMAGITYVAHAAGELENTLAVSYEKTILDDEIIGMAKRLVGRFGVSAETLAGEVIHSVGPRGHFLDHDHTMRHFRAEQHLPISFDRDKFEIWEEAGGRRAEERARDRFSQIRTSHTPLPLDPHAAAELEAIYQTCRRNMEMG